MRPFLLVSGDFVRTGGMDMANFALARYLAARGGEVHLVAHRVSDELRAERSVVFHRVPKPAGSYLVGSPLLHAAGLLHGTRIAARGGRVVVNGGNCAFGDANWVHYVHGAYRARIAAGAVRRAKHEVAHQLFLREERLALGRARVVVANSERTRRDLIERVGVPSERIRVLYYGIDPERFQPASDERRAAGRALLPCAPGRRAVAFLGAVGDRRKGLDTAVDAFAQLCAEPAWDGDLVVIGAGAELPAWRARVAQRGLAERIHFLGFRSDVPVLLAGCDALLAPTRYEAYGLGVQEALCCGMPALVSRDAGVAERYPAGLARLLLDDPDDARAVAARLREWRRDADGYRGLALALSEQLRRETWDRMAERFVALLEEGA